MKFYSSIRNRRYEICGKMVGTEKYYISEVTQAQKNSVCSVSCGDLIPKYLDF